MSERNVIAEIRAMRWMIAVLLTQLVILTAAFVAVAVQALSTPVTRGMPAVIVIHPPREITAAGGASGISDMEKRERPEAVPAEPGE